MCSSKMLMKLFKGKEKMKTTKDNKMVKLDFILFFSIFQNYLFWAYIRKNGTFSFWCMVIPLGPYLVYTNVGPV